jgi:hypothetical protein
LNGEIVGEIRALNVYQRLHPILSTLQVFLPIAAVSVWIITAFIMGSDTPEWMEPAVLCIGLLVPGLIFGIDRVFPRDIDSIVEQTICNSDMLKDWYINTTFSGPGSYLSGDGLLNGDIAEEKSEIAVYKKNPAILITLFHSENDNKSFMEPWLDPLVRDKDHNSQHRVSVTYNGAEVIEKRILCIDGGRCYFPLPISSQPPLQADFLSIAICQILNRKDDYSTQFYFKPASVDVIDVERFDPQVVRNAMS